MADNATDANPLRITQADLDRAARESNEAPKAAVS
jgi:hypothetical protein